MDHTPNDVIVQSWSELCELLYTDSWQRDIGRYRSNYAFRGVSDRRYDLQHRFARFCSGHPHLEYHLLRNFRKYAQVPGDAQFSDWRWMTLAQHYGLPTRLLDWTYSPFVAVHFATAKTLEPQTDAAVWMVDFVRVNQTLPPPLADVLAEEKANAFTLGMLERALPNLRALVKVADGDQRELALFVEPPSLDARIINQFALFSVTSTPTQGLDVWLADHPEFYRRLIIPRELKWEVRDKLDQANITERTLFPGLDGLARWLTRHYSPAMCLDAATPPGE
ncbi:MAG: FRG domain-containing protein [Deltaproteobacteria bacterium]|nr:FRG domain-containing protein [Deltaproteobacteria bacterium]